MAEDQNTDDKSAEDSGSEAPSGAARDALKKIISEVFDEKKEEWSKQPPARTKGKSFFENILGM